MTDPLVEACCQQHADHVAGLLRGRAPTDINAFLAELGPDTAARVLARLESRPMYACLASMEAANLARIIASAGHEDSVEIIAHLSNRRYQELADAADGDALATRLYAFSERTLGAIAGPEFVRVKSGRRCGEVSADLAGSEHKRDAPLYLVDARGVLLGKLPLLAVIADRNAQLEVDQLARPAHPLSHRMTVAAALEAREWVGAAVLPVVDGNQHLIGTVSQQQLLRLTRREGGTGYSLEQLTGDLAAEYLNTCASLIELLLQGRSAR